MMTGGQTARRGARAAALAAAVASAMLAGACSPNDVELNGKLFDAVGATGLVGKPSGQVKMVERQGIIVPPSLDKLPPPGEVAPTAQLAEVKDPDRMKRVNAAELQRQQAAYCKEHYELAKLRGNSDADSAVGPAGSCRPSALTAFEKWNKADSEEPAAEETTAAIPPANGTVSTVTGSTVQVGTVTAVPAGKTR